MSVVSPDLAEVSLAVRLISHGKPTASAVRVPKGIGFSQTLIFSCGSRFVFGLRILRASRERSCVVEYPPPEHFDLVSGMSQPENWERYSRIPVGGRRPPEFPIHGRDHHSSLAQGCKGRPVHSHRYRDVLLHSVLVRH